MHVARAGVVGAGTMGAAIAELLAFNGIDVVMKDVDRPLVEKGLAKVRSLVDGLVAYHASRADKELAKVTEEVGELTEAQRARLRAELAPKITRARGDEIIARVRGVDDYSAFANVDLVVEAVFEQEEVKRPVLEALDAVVPAQVVIGTNTSSLSLTKLARGLRHARRLVVMHFFNPPSVLPLVEVAGGIETSDELVQEAIDFLAGLKNHRSQLVPIRTKESPAFVVNRLLIPILNEACFALDEHVAGAREIDVAMKSGAGLPMGPFELADMIGLDVILEVCETLMREFGDPKYRPSPLLRRMVASGRLGRKTGRGFYEYPA